jgi:MFS family permease
MKLGERFSSLAEPMFRRYFIGRSISTLGTAMTQVALPFAVFAIHGSAADVGLVLGAAVLPKVLLVLLGGVVGDRWERRLVLLATDSCMALCQIGTGAVLLTGVAHVWQLLVFQLGYGCASAFALPATTGAVADVLASRNRLQQANSLMMVARNVSGIIGPPCAGVLVAVSGPGWAFAVDALTFVVSAATMALLPAGLRVGRPAQFRLRTDIAEGWRNFTAQSWIWLMVISFAIYQATVLPAIYVVGPRVAESTIGVAGWAAVLAARSAGALVAGVPLLSWRPRRPLLLAAALLLLDVPFLVALVYHGSLVVLMLSAAVAAAGLNAADTLWATALQERVPADALARVSSYDWLGSLVFAPFGYAIIGGAIDTAGVDRTMAVIIVSHLVIHLILPGVRSVRRAERVAEPAAEPAAAASL